MKKKEQEGRKLVEDYGRHLMGYLRPRTVETYIKDVSAFMPTIRWDVSKFTQQTAESFLTMVFGDRLAGRTTASPATRNQRISALTSFATWLIKVAKVLTVNPMEDVRKSRPKQRLPEYLTEEEMATVLDGQDTTRDNGVRDRAMLEFMYCSGCRASEVADLTLNNLDLEKGEAKIIGKGDKERKVYLSESCIEWMKRYINGVRDKWRQKARRRGDRMLRVFTNRWFETPNRNDIYTWVLQCGKNAGLSKKLHPHMIRHTFGTTMIRNGANIIAVKEVMGHASVATTQIYTSVTEEDKKDAVRNIFNKKN